MSCRAVRGTVLVLPLALIIGGCAGSVPPAGAPDPVIVESADAPDVVVAEQPSPVRERDAAPRDRWLTPFAVSSTGEVEPLRPRSIIVVGSDSAIAAGLSEQQAIDLNGGARADRDERPGAADSGRRPGGWTTPTTSRASSAAPDGRDRRDEPMGPSADEVDATIHEDSTAGINTRNHLVQRGDTWLGIAAQYRVEPDALADANPNVDPQRIRIGQRLMVPPAASREVRSRVHRVGPGDTLSEIAERYSVPQAEIRRANDLTGDRIRVGQTLTIPSGS